LTLVVFPPSAEASDPLAIVLEPRFFRSSGQTDRLLVDRRIVMRLDLGRNFCEN